MNKAIVSTEVWDTKSGVVSKAVVRDAKGHFIGATNQTKGVPLKVKSMRVKNLSIVGR